jgi:hypothetical protein
MEKFATPYRYLYPIFYFFSKKSAIIFRTSRRWGDLGGPEGHQNRGGHGTVGIGGGSV